jgi:hypothetical protein
MFLDPAQLPVARMMAEELAAADAALDRIASDEFVEWVLGDAYRGRWRLFGLHHRDPGWVMAERFNSNGRDPRMEAIAALLARVPALISSAFMSLEAGSHIFPHVDDPAVRSVRMLLGLRTNAGARMRVGDEVRTIERGRVYCFDSATLHEAANEGATPRVVWGVEVEHARARDPLLPPRAGQARSLSPRV